MSVYHEPDLRYDKPRTAAYAIAGLILAAAVLICLYFVFNPRLNAAPAITNVTTITSNPANYVGRNVAVQGRVANIVNGSAFTVIDPRVAAGPQMLVIGTQPVPPVAGRPDNPGLISGDVVAVEGQVRKFSPDDHAYGIDTTLPDYRPFVGMPVVYARVITPPGGQAVVVTPHGGTNIPAQPVYTGRASANDRRTEVSAIRQDPKALLGQRVQVVNALVTEVDSDRGFWIKNDAPERLFVVLSPGLDKKPVEWMVVVKPGQNVTVNGVVTSLPPIRTLEKKWKMTPTTARELAKEQVYLFADGIYIQQH